MLFYSHIWDLLLKLTWLFAVVVLLVDLHVAEWLQKIGVPSDYTVPTAIGVGTVLWISVYRQGLSTIASWLYATVNLGAGVSLSDARQLARLFQLDLSLKWVPLKEVKQLPKADRKDALLAALERLRPGRKSMLF
ncbi:MAG TPA: hypothetical protein VGQ48_04300 [Gemmatimonadales bacterium]|jgi:hypothetical protein|nr:hypothetical protein [Gemmatimonadales bacterium]